jgi:hypothetical protein
MPCADKAQGSIVILRKEHAKHVKDRLEMYHCGDCTGWPMRKREMADGSRGTGHTSSQGAGLNKVAVLGWGPEKSMDSRQTKHGSSNDSVFHRIKPLRG